MAKEQITKDKKRSAVVMLSLAAGIAVFLCVTTLIGSQDSMLLSTECPHGHQALEGYLLPVNLAMGATFNPQMAADAYHLCGRQMNEM